MDFNANNLYTIPWQGNGQKMGREVGMPSRINPNNGMMREFAYCPACVCPPEEPIEPIYPILPIEPIYPILPIEPMPPVTPVPPIFPMPPVSPIEPIYPILPIEPMPPVTPVPPIFPMPPMPIEPEQPECMIPRGSLAMAYVPMQNWKQPYDPAVGFVRGTIFQELDMPFMGEGNCTNER